MTEREEVAVCITCGWLGTGTEQFEGYEVCPECLSAVEWEPASNDGSEDDEDMDTVFDMPHTEPRGTFLERHWRTGLPARPGGGYSRPAYRAPVADRTVVASKPRQGLLKGCMAACREVGLALRWGSAEQREQGRTLLRATGRVCVAPDEVSNDPVGR